MLTRERAGEEQGQSEQAGEEQGQSEEKKSNVSSKVLFFTKQVRTFQVNRELKKQTLLKRV